MVSVQPAEKRRLLSETPFFAAFPPAQRDALAAHLSERNCDDGGTIFLRGDDSTSLMIVVAGRVALRLTSPQGREILLAILEPGEIFGEMSLLDGRGRSADAVAFGDCRLLILERRDMVPVLRDSPEACIRLLELLSARLRRTSDQLEGVALLALPSRLARLLLALSETHGTRSGAGQMLLPLSLSQRDLGQLIGASREKVNLQLGRWVADGLLTREDGALGIRDRDALADIADMGAP
ncbi:MULTISPECIES: Crp/Fnr family transcriptional regulator [Inquilinus]|uniref:CRP-like cAMP-binding protein n=1 Tax=Inquilinus ginsengisoli TaxID=363840 RepID=A0ABU1JWB3_9PROT|nr:Crp/Fnr family transcriptional regulator [Inquilinus ginsengisoli]MDR6292587.1 CRP-like cAMP-binding protein [Inquilinus ginsengisoli]